YPGPAGGQAVLAAVCRRRYLTGEGHVPARVVHGRSSVLTGVSTLPAARSPRPAVCGQGDASQVDGHLTVLAQGGQDLLGGGVLLLADGLLGELVAHLLERGQLRILPALPGLLHLLHIGVVLLAQLVLARLGDVRLRL